MLASTMRSERSRATGCVFDTWWTRCATSRPLVAHGLTEKMKEEMPFYLAACTNAPLIVDRSDIDEMK